MQGALGIGANLNKWTQEDFTLAKTLITLDKQIRATVQNGALYRLLSPRDNDVTANQYVSADGKQSVLFAFRHSQQFELPAPSIRLQGLDPNAVYTLTSLDNRTSEHSGAYLANHGIDLTLTGDYASTIIVLTKQ